LEVYGPPGIKHMTEHVLEAYRADFETRSKHFEEKLNAVGSFPTLHAMESYGYRFETADRRIVIFQAIPIRRRRRSTRAMVAMS